jgi:predicted acylesterase/phospholipase RssA
MLLELVIKQRLDFHILRGVSVGALNSAFLAQADSDPPNKSLRNLQAQVRKLRNLWRDEIHDNHDVYGERSGFAGLALGADSLYSIKPLWEKLKRHIDVKDIRKSKRDFAVGTVSLTSGEYEEWTPAAKGFLRRILASASIPVVFPFVDFEDERDVLVDGGARNITPLSSAFSAKPPPDEIYVLLTSRVMRNQGDLDKGAVMPQKYDQWDDNFLGTKVNGIDVLKRTIDILTDEIYLDDLRGALDWNTLLAALGRLDGALDNQANSAAVKTARKNLEKKLQEVKKRPVPIKVLAPREWYGDDNSSTEFSRRRIADAIEHGKKIAANPNLWVVK